MTDLLSAIPQWAIILFNIVTIAMMVHVGYEFLWKELRPRTRGGWATLVLFFVAPLVASIVLGFAGASERETFMATYLTMSAVIAVSLWRQHHNRRTA